MSDFEIYRDKMQKYTEVMKLSISEEEIKKLFLGSAIMFEILQDKAKAELEKKSSNEQ